MNYGLSSSLPHLLMEGPWLLRARHCGPAQEAQTFPPALKGLCSISSLSLSFVQPTFLCTPFVSLAGT